jgi:flagellar basal body-associated protein FliL
MVGLLSSVITSKALVEAEKFLDGDQSVFSFEGTVLKCDGFFSHNQIYKDITKNLTWIIIVGIILAVVLTIVLNSYWPILLTIYNQLRKLLIQQEKEGSDNQIQLIQVQNKQSSKQEETALAEHVAILMEEKRKEREKPKSKDKLLVVWIVICLICTLIMALVVVAIIITYWVFLTPVGQELICRVLNTTQARRLSNQEGASLVSILGQNETENSTTLLMPCHSIGVDELGHTYNFSGPYYLDCEEEWVNFNYTDTVEVYHNDRCCGFKNTDSRKFKKEEIIKYHR